MYDVQNFWAQDLILPAAGGKNFGGVGPIINGGPIITLCYDVRCTEFLCTGSDVGLRAPLLERDKSLVFNVLVFEISNAILGAYSDHSPYI